MSEWSMVPGPPSTSTLHPNMRGPETRTHCYQSAATQQRRSPIQGEKQGLECYLSSLWSCGVVEGWRKVHLYYNDDIVPPGVHGAAVPRAGAGDGCGQRGGLPHPQLLETWPQHLPPRTGQNLFFVTVILFVVTNTSAIICRSKHGSRGTCSSRPGPRPWPQCTEGPGGSAPEPGATRCLVAMMPWPMCARLNQDCCTHNSSVALKNLLQYYKPNSQWPIIGQHPISSLLPSQIVDFWERRSSCAYCVVCNVNSKQVFVISDTSWERWCPLW